MDGRSVIQTDQNQDDRPSQWYEKGLCKGP